MTDALVNLRVPAATKARWVRDSRAAGMRLTDWIVERLEAHMQGKQLIVIPAGLAFADLRLARDSDGAVSFDATIIERIARASGLAADYFRVRPEEAASELIVRWYTSHRIGGAADPVADDLIAEASAEDERGGGLSHQPGRA